MERYVELYRQVPILHVGPKSLVDLDITQGEITYLPPRNSAQLFLKGVGQELFNIYFFQFEGHVNGNDKEVKGKVEIPNFSEEHTDLKDVDIEVQLTTKVCRLCMCL